MVRRCITKRRVRSYPMVHRASQPFPKPSQSCRAKSALTLHYQPRFRRNQSTSTHNSAAPRAPLHTACCTFRHRSFSALDLGTYPFTFAARVPGQWALMANIHRLETPHKPDSEDIRHLQPSRPTSTFI